MDWASDWEKLFARCATDKDYRQQIIAAIDANDDEQLGTLLDTMGIAGTSEQRTQRISALKTTFQPMRAAAEAFDADLEAAAAP